MLILMRRPGEVIRVGQDIEIIILGVKGAKVNVGIQAPKEVQVHREEVYQRIKVEEVMARNNGHTP